MIGRRHPLAPRFRSCHHAAPRARRTRRRRRPTPDAPRRRLPAHRLRRDGGSIHRSSTCQEAVIEIRTTEPQLECTLTLNNDDVTREPTAAFDRHDLDIAAEAFIPVVYGRLGSGITLRRVYHCLKDIRVDPQLVQSSPRKRPVHLSHVRRNAPKDTVGDLHHST